MSTSESKSKSKSASESVSQPASASATGPASSSGAPPAPAISQAKMDANRRNARLSTGPRTPGGKARVSRNALRHGLAAKADRLLVLSEDAEAFRHFRRDVRRELRPEGPIERALAKQVALRAWRLDRCAEMEASLLNRDLGMAHHVAMTQLPRPHRQRWYEQPHPIVVGTVLGEAMAGPSSPYETLRRYERTMERAFYAAKRELERTQDRRHLALGTRHLGEEEERHLALGTRHLGGKAEEEEEAGEAGLAGMNGINGIRKGEKQEDRLAATRRGARMGEPESPGTKGTPEGEQQVGRARAHAGDVPTGQPGEAQPPDSSSDASVSSPSAQCPVPLFLRLVPSAKCLCFFA